jgi:hypothetical protein
MPTEVDSIRRLPEPFASCPDAIEALDSGDQKECEDAVEYFRDIFLAYQGSHHDACVLFALPKLARFIEQDAGLDEEHQAALADVLFSFGERLETQRPRPEVVEALRKHFPMALDPPAQ